MKRTVIAILVAVLVVAIGAGLCFAGLSAVQFDFKKLDRTEYRTNTYAFDGVVSALDLEGFTADFELLTAEDGCRVVAAESERERYSVALEDGTLRIRPETDLRKWSLFTFRSPKISVYLPAGAYESLKASLGTGDLTAAAGLSFGGMDLKLTTGDLTMTGVGAGTVIVRSDTGDVRLSDMTPERLDVALHTGRIVLTNVVCAGDLVCESSTGDIRLTDVDGANLYLKASTGDITGTVRTGKAFSAHASTGSVKVPDTAGQGRCEAQTSTGDIRLSVSGK